MIDDVGRFVELEIAFTEWKVKPVMEVDTVIAVISATRDKMRESLKALESVTALLKGMKIQLEAKKM